MSRSKSPYNCIYIEIHIAINVDTMRDRGLLYINEINLISVKIETNTYNLLTHLE